METAKENTSDEDDAFPVSQVESQDILWPLLTILLMSVAKVTPLLGLSWEPLLLPPREFLLMMPAEGGTTHCHIMLSIMILSRRGITAATLPHPGAAGCPAAAGCSCGTGGSRHPWTGGAVGRTAWRPGRRCQRGAPSPSSGRAPRSPSSGRPAGPAPPSHVCRGRCEGG